MKLLLAILMLGCCAAQAATIVADSAAVADVQAAVSSAATGDIVEFPASPGTVTWTTNLNFGNKIFTLNGKGWTIVDENPNRSVPAGAMFYSALFTASGSTNSYLCISNLTIQGGVTNTTLSVWGTVVFNATSPWWRLCHIRWELPNGRPGFITTSPGGGGLIDNNVFHLDYSGWYLRNDNSGDNGHLAWSTNYWATNTWGGYEALGNAIYFENNLITNGTSHRAFIDGDAGMIYVARSNTSWNSSFENHGRESAQRRRGGFWQGVYSNQFLGSIVSEYAMLLRSGSGYAAGNNVAGVAYPGLARLVNYQAYANYLPYGFATGANPYDLNYAGGPFDTGTRTAGGPTNQFIDSTKSWTVNEWVGYCVVKNPAFTNGTGSQSTTTVTATTDLFTAASVGSYVRFANGAISLITAYGAANSVTVNSSRTVTSQAFTVESLDAAMIATNNATTLVFAVRPDGTYMSCAEGDTMAIYRVNRPLDASGAGPGQLLTGGGDSPFVSPLAIAWPNQQTNTFRAWGNSGTTTVGGDLVVVGGRDYTNTAPAEFSPLAYPHPLNTDSGGGGGGGAAYTATAGNVTVQKKTVATQ